MCYTLRKSALQGWRPRRMGAYRVMRSANTRYPATTWELQPATADTGWDLDRLERAELYAQRLGSAAVVVLVDGEVAIAWGAIDRPFNCHSIRKSLFGGLFGIYVHNG